MAVFTRRVHLITGYQTRAARDALNWSVQKLADATSAGTAGIVRCEQFEGLPKSRKDNIERIKPALEAAGIEFTGTSDVGHGIRTRAIPEK